MKFGTIPIERNLTTVFERLSYMMCRVCPLLEIL